MMAREKSQSERDLPLPEIFLDKSEGKNDNSTVVPCDEEMDHKSEVQEVTKGNKVKNASESGDDSSDTKVELQPNNLVSKKTLNTLTIEGLIVKCSACGKQVNHHDSHRVKKHRHLGVLVCKDCSEFYGNGEFSQDDEGDKYCRWCAQGGQVFGCDFCNNVFCSDCIRRNFGRGENRKIRETKWKCYVCNPSQIKEKVSFCEVILKYSQIAKQSRKASHAKKASQSIVQCPLDKLDPKVFQPAEWLPAAFDSALGVSIKFKNKIEKLRRHATSGKSTKQIVRKLEQVMDHQKMDIKKILNEVHERYKMYAREKLAASVPVPTSVTINISDDSDVETINTAVHISNDSTLKDEKSNMSSTLPSTSTVNVPNGFNSRDACDSTESVLKVEESQILSKPESAIRDEDVKKTETFASDLEATCIIDDDDVDCKKLPSPKHNTSSPLFGESQSEDEKMEDVLKLIAKEVEDDKTSDAILPDIQTTSIDVSVSDQISPSDDKCTDIPEPIDANAAAKDLLLQISDDSAAEGSETSTVPNASDSDKVRKKQLTVVKDAVSSNMGSSSSDTDSSEDSDSVNSEFERKVTVRRPRKKKVKKGLNCFSAKDIISKDQYQNDPKLNSRAIVLVEKLDISNWEKPDVAESPSPVPETADVTMGEKDEENELDQLKKYVQQLSILPDRKRVRQSSEGSKKASPPAVKKKKVEPKKVISSDSEMFTLSSADEEEKVKEKGNSDVPTKTALKDMNNLSKNALLNNDSDTSSSSDLDSDSSGFLKKDNKPKKIKKVEEDYTPKVENLVSDDDDDDDDAFVLTKRKKIDKLLKVSLANSDEEKSKDKQEKSSGKQKQKAKKRKVIYSDDSASKAAKSASSCDSTTSDSDRDEKRKKGKNAKQKRKRVKVADDSSDENKGSDDEKNNSQGTPGKGRKNIRKVISHKKLTDATIEAQEAEKERRKRIADRQKLYNKIVDVSSDGSEMITRKMVLEVDPDSKEEVVEIHPDIVEKLKPHQINGVKFMWECTIESVKELEKDKPGSGCILAHCMGLGKTLQVIAYIYTVLTNKIAKKKMRTAMIICPYNTVLNWVSEFEKWLEDVDESINIFEMACVKTTYSRRDYLQQWHDEGGVLILGYNIFARLADGKVSKATRKLKDTIFQLLCDPGPDIVVCDEGHMLKNENSCLSKAASKLKSQRRIVLTGTPLQNNLKEYHCMMNFVKPNLLGTLREFTNRFVNPIINGQYDDSSKYDVKLMKKRVHILHKLLEGCVQRCDYSALTKFLPPKHEFVISVKLSDVQINLYRHFLDKFARGQGGQVDGGKLFQDYSVLKNIWTYPWILFLAFYRAEKKKLFCVSDSEDSMGSFIDDSEDDSDKDKEVECIDEANPKPGPSKKKSESSGDEVIRTYKTRSRGRIEGEEVEEEVQATEASKQWWNEFLTEDEKFKMETSGKMILFLDILRESQSIGDKILLFTQSLLTLDMIEDILQNIDEEPEKENEENKITDAIDTWVPEIDYFRMDGNTNVELRKRWIEIFNDPENDRARLFLISTKAGSLGTNLIGANRVIMLDASWNPSHDVQAIFRVYRFGQIKPVYIYRLLAQGTMEEKIYNRQVTKLSLSCRVVDEQQIDRHYNAAQLAELYTFEPNTDTNRPTPMVPNDRLLADMLIRHSEWIVKYHEHDSLLQSSTEDDLTEEERQAAWTEYEDEKEGKFNTVNMNGAQSNMGFDSNAEYMNINTLPNVDVAVATMMTELKKQNPTLSAVELMTKCYLQLVNFKSYYQGRHVTCLRYKQQAISKGEMVPPTIAIYLSALEKALEKISVYIENCHMKLSTLQRNVNRQAQAQAQAQSFQQTNAPRNFQDIFNARIQNAHQNYRHTYYNPNAGAMPRFVNVETGRTDMRLPPGAKVIRTYTRSNDPPTIVDITADKETTSVSNSTPIITEVEDTSDKTDKKSANKQTTVEITEID